MAKEVAQTAQHRNHDVIPFFRRKDPLRGFMVVRVTLQYNAAWLFYGIVDGSLAPEHNLNR
ncbi:hypothetical protein [Paraburkholderia sp.]|uniref:hypothetical protein n=1 Tax=Paraburkholderia sp. TaxID=1926495 RepID=UPI0025DB8102|nr:hypothetical protein [Paraburkholderia sp.]